MFYRLLLSLLIFAFLNNRATPADNENAGNSTEPQISINDSILEFFYNCTCIPYFSCSEINRYTFAARANILPKKLTCTDTNFLCCKNTTDADLTDPVTESPVTTPTSGDIKQKSVEKNSTTETPITESPSVRENPIPLQHECGVAKTEIAVRILTPDTESATTIPGEVPWIVEIFRKRTKPKNPKKAHYELKCAGSLIHPQAVVTATHCVASNDAKSLHVVATGLGHFQNVGVNSENERSVIKVIKHPEYYSGGLFNDIALLILKTEYNFTSKLLNSICLPNLNHNFNGRRCIAAGWGQNPELRNVSLNKVDIPMIESSKCQDLLRETTLGPDFNLHSSFVCAGGEEGKDTCKGDGGGPLMCFGDEYQFVLTGIVSWGIDNKCGVANQPGIYTNVAKFTNWIAKELEKNGLKLDQ